MSYSRMVERPVCRVFELDKMMNGMMIKNLFRIGAISAFAALAACTTSPEVARFNSAAGITEQVYLSALSRQFIEQTPFTVNFDFDKDNLDRQARRDLDIQAAWILAHPDVRFSVFGHTDKVGSNAYNEDLGLRRAMRVVAYLASRGINTDRLQALVTHGEELPIIQIELRERTNRRATTVVIGFFTPELSADRADRIIPPDPDPDPKKPKKPKNPNAALNAGRGNGDEDGDPGNSEGHNNGGDEVT